MASFRDRFFTPNVARAITSPSAILATGAGAAAGIIIGGWFGGWILAPVVGAAALAARVLVAVPRETTPAVDTRSLDEPWKSLLKEIRDSGARFHKAISGMQAGPLSERLNELSGRLDTAVAEAGRIAAAGNQLARARSQIDTAAAEADLQRVHGESPSQRRDQTMAAIRAQLSSAARIDSTTWDTYERLKLLDARIDEMVARSLELSVTQASGEGVSGLGDEVEAIVSDMETLRQAIDETRSAEGVDQSGLMASGPSAAMMDQSGRTSSPGQTSSGTGSGF